MNLLIFIIHNVSIALKTNLHSVFLHPLPYTVYYVAVYGQVFMCFSINFKVSVVLKRVALCDMGNVQILISMAQASLIFLISAFFFW